MSDPLLTHLLDIVSEPAAEGLILAGGFGIRIKQNHVRETGVRTLIAEIPPARATQDLDFFLRMELFLRPEKGRAVRSLLDGLEYKPNPDNANWQFEKPHDGGASGRLVTVDLLSRSPHPDEAVNSDGRRVGKKSDVGLHGSKTVEAFAVEEKPVHVTVEGKRSDGRLVQAGVFVAHPYAMIQMKIKAAYDWLHRDKYKAGSEKHAFDVYLLVAMLTEQEVNDCIDLRDRFSGDPMTADHGRYAEELFGTVGARGFDEAVRQAKADGRDIRPEHGAFLEASHAVIGSLPG